MGKVIYNLFGEYIFCLTLKEDFLEPKFLFLPKRPLFLPFEPSGRNCKFVRKTFGFLTNSKILFMSPGEKSIVTLKMSVTNFFRFQYFENFDIKFLLLGQNYF